MQPWVASLLAVQDLDTRLIRLRAQIDSVPAERKRAQAVAAEAAAAVAVAKQALADEEKGLKSLDLDIQTIEAKRREFETKTAMIKNNTEYKAALEQIASWRRQIRELEDRQLVLMEQIEAARQSLERTRQEGEAAARRAEQMVADLETRAANCTAQMAKLQEERARHAAAVPAATMRKYDRLMGSRLKSGKKAVAFAAVRDDEHDGLRDYLCGYCHMKVPPQIRMNALKGLEVACPNCAVLLYQDDAEGSAPAQSA
ncbi:MAG: putative zinc ribbon domain protein [Lentisphaerae bacterium ADurb.BinA184]|nr:MAG: putative zinc ribbon domain protein [Lentisphaerae bacterium ADurb.BinA184]